jgi:Fur family transcriptional regulator, ferric uptake regulator
LNHSAIRKRFVETLRAQNLKFTSQRERIFERSFLTHQHFTADTLHSWLKEEEGPRVSRATVYRTLRLLEEGGFIASVETGRGEFVYEHILGHQHHDHLICLGCGKLEEFRNDTIERLQEETAESKGFTLVRHSLRLEGYCRSCTRKRESASKREGESS